MYEIFLILNKMNVTPWCAIYIIVYSFVYEDYTVFEGLIPLLPILTLFGILIFSDPAINGDTTYII